MSAYPVLVMTGTGTAIARESTALPVPALLVAPIVISKLPDTLGVPLITPVVELNFKPAGRPLALKLEGKSLAVTVYVKGTP